MCIFDSEYCVLLEVQCLYGKQYGNTNTCMHIVMNTNVLILGLQKDIEMSYLSVIEVNSIFTWLPEIALTTPFIINHI